MGTLLFFFIFSIAFSFLCSILEAVLLSVTPSYTRQQVKQATSTGMLLQAYKEDIDRPLSAILTLNTLAHTVGAIGVGAQAGAIYGSESLSIGPIALSYESIVAALMTLAILILSEIIPKTIGANNWKVLSPFTVQTIRVLLWVLAPLVWVSQLITKSLKNDKNKSVLTRADFLDMASVGATSGALKEDESTIIYNLLNFGKQIVADTMTPRKVAMMAHKDMTVQEFMRLPDANAHSRIPVYGKDKDEVLGYVLKDEIYLAVARDKNPRLEDLLREVSFVREKTTLPDLFNRLITEREHLFMVHDEYGQVVGLVTMEDLFEDLLGREIMDESDKVEDLQQHARKKWEGRRKKDT